MYTIFINEKNVFDSKKTVKKVKKHISKCKTTIYIDKFHYINLNILFNT